jgi:hypothetical protein
MALKCPNCDAALPASEVAGGWCESCGKKLPPSITPADAPKREAARPGEGGGGVTLFGIIWTVVLLAVGPLVVIHGFREIDMLRKAGAEPTACEVADLEPGKPIPQTYIRLGKHARLYPLSVYTIRQSQKGDTDPDVMSLLVPVVSAAHPDLREGAKGMKPGKLRVLIKTQRFKKRSAIPAQPVVAEEVTGLVVSEVSALGDEEHNLLKDAFSEADLRDVLIVEEGSKPYSMAWPVLRIAIGAAMALYGGWLVLRTVRGFFGRR